MLIHRVGILSATLCCFGSACGSSPSAPSPEHSPQPAVGYTGQWSGITTQGSPVSFTVSSEQTVTEITVGYNVNGCSGLKTFSNVSLPIARGPNPDTSPGPGFGIGSAMPDGTDYIQIVGWFTSGATASGIVTFAEFAGCGSAGTIWSATRR